MSKPGKPDGIKVRILAAGEFGNVGDELILATALAEQQIAAGNAEAVVDAVEAVPEQ